jgi:hypothetical protein
VDDLSAPGECIASPQEGMCVVEVWDAVHCIPPAGIVAFRDDGSSLEAAARL